MGKDYIQHNKLIISDQPSKQPDKTGRPTVKVDRLFIWRQNPSFPAQYAAILCLEVKMI
jgi:hypothetical protein